MALAGHPAARVAGIAGLEDLLRRAHELREAGDWGDEAARVYEQLAERAPQAAGPLVMLASCHERAGRSREARVAYERALALPDRGRFDRRIRNGLKRARSLERAAGLSTVTDALRVAGLARDEGRADLALAASARGVELATSPGEQTAALACRASIVLDAGRPGEALELARRSIAADPSRETNRQTYAVLVAALLEAGRTDDAKAEGERLLAANPTDPGSARALAAAYRRLFELTGERRWQAAAESCRARAAGPRLR